jgi:hypothetical protein
MLVSCGLCLVARSGWEFAGAVICAIGSALCFFCVVTGARFGAAKGVLCFFGVELRRCLGVLSKWVGVWAVLSEIRWCGDLGFGLIWGS